VTRANKPATELDNVTANLQFEELFRDAATLDARGSRLAGGLRALGLNEGDAVAVLLRNDPVYADVIHASRIGGTYYCPLNWHFTWSELGYILGDSGARAVIGHADLLEAARSVIPSGCPVLSVGGAGKGDLAYEDWLASQPSFGGPPAMPRSHFCYTSGTTGRPKGVLRFPVAPEQAAKMRSREEEVVSAALGIQPGCRALLSAPLYHSAPTVFAQRALEMAQQLVLAPRFDAEETLILLEKYRIDVLYLVPVMYVRLLKLSDAVRKRYDLSSLRFIASTGAPCAPDIKRAMIEWLGPLVNETYGLSL
jgi:long-chain acyl-CoA synthetase